MFRKLITGSLKKGTLSVRWQSHGLTSSLVEQTKRIHAQQVKPYIKEKLSQLTSSYDELFGLSSLRKIQEAVVDAESSFIEATTKRRQAQEMLKELHRELQFIREKIDASPRSSDVFLELITREHSLIKEEIQASDMLRQLEDQERHLFERLSKLVSRSHEFERLRQEKAKYISLLGSIIGAVMGILGTSLNHAYRVHSENKRIASLSLSQGNSQNRDAVKDAALSTQIQKDVRTISENVDQVINDVHSIEADWAKLQSLLDLQKSEQRKVALFCLITCIYVTALTTFASVSHR